MEPQPTRGVTLPDLDGVRRFYDAMHRLDVDALLHTLSDDFIGHVAAGLPGGFGGTYHGPKTMLDEVWVPVYRALRALPHPREYLSCGDGTVVVVGDYRGSLAGEDFSAEFAHILRVTGGRLTELRQITDTRRWPDPER